VRIVVWSGDDVLQVPAGAVFRSGDGWAVFVVEAGRARRVPVRLGHRGADQVEVVAGVEEGRLVVLYPPDRLADGARVVVEERR
jgi:HlyD family secretion protein